MHTKHGMFDESLKYAGDWEMWLRAVRHNAKFMKIPGVYSIYYVNPEGKAIDKQFNDERSVEIKKIQMEY